MFMNISIPLSVKEPLLLSLPNPNLMTTESATFGAINYCTVDTRICPPADCQNTTVMCVSNVGPLRYYDVMKLSKRPQYRVLPLLTANGCAYIRARETGLSVLFLHAVFGTFIC